MPRTVNSHDEELKPFIPHSIEGENNWIATASLIVCAMAGVGVLGLPNAMFQSGWLGIVLCLVCAAFSSFTGWAIGKSMEQTPHSESYADLGEQAFGKPGRYLALFSVYTTLAGVAIIFLILLGLLMSGIVPLLSHGLWTLLIGLVIVTPISVALKSYGEIKWISIFGFLATAIVVVVASILSIVFRKSSYYETEKAIWEFETKMINPPTFVIGFSVFTFAFGASAIFPSIYRKMKNPADWTRSVFGGYTASLLLYLPISLIGYGVYGSYLGKADDILAAIQMFDKSTQFLTKICQALMILHIVSAFPIVINPVFLAVESRWESSSTYSSGVLKRVVFRVFLMSTLIIIALFFPYFLNIMSIVSDISVSLSGFILPALFYWKICRPPVHHKMLCFIIAAFGIIGSAIGLYVATKQLIDNVHSKPNPFKGLFAIHH